MGILSTDNYVPILKSLVHLINKKANITRVDELESSVTTTFNEHNVASDAHADLFEAKQDTLTFDSTPTEGSENPVTSDGIAKYVRWENLPDKPFGTELGFVELVPTQSVSFSTYNGMNMGSFPPSGTEFVIGQTYVVEWDGVEYECVAKDVGVGVPAIGNVSLMGGADDTGEPFLMTSDGIMGQSLAKEAGTYEASISGMGKIIRPLDSTYLPAPLIIDATNLPTSNSEWRDLYYELKTARENRTDVFLDLFGDGEALIPSVYVGTSIVLFLYDGGPNSMIVYRLIAMVNDGGSLETFTLSEIEDVVKTVNSIAPDENGNVALEIPAELPAVTSSNAGQVLTVNESGVWSAAASPIPSVTADDNGKLLRVVDGAWAAVTIDNAEGVSF